MGLDRPLRKQVMLNMKDGDTVQSLLQIAKRVEQIDETEQKVVNPTIASFRGKKFTVTEMQAIVSQIGRMRHEQSMNHNTTTRLDSVALSTFFCDQVA